MGSACDTTNRRFQAGVFDLLFLAEGHFEVLTTLLLDPCRVILEHRFIETIVRDESDGHFLQFTRHDLDTLLSKLHAHQHMLAKAA